MARSDRIALTRDLTRDLTRGLTRGLAGGRAIARALGVALTLACALGASSARAEELPPPPTMVLSRAYAPVGGEQAELAPRPSRGPALGLTIAGAVSLGASWIFDGLVGAFAGYHVCLFSWGSCALEGYEPGWDTFHALAFVPALGPWMQLANLPSSGDGWPAWLVADGLVQAAGLGMLIAGVVMLSDTPETGREGAHRRAPGPSFALVPSLGARHAALSLAGSF